MSIKICGFCGKEFEIASPNQKFCSKECARKYAGSITKSIGCAAHKVKHTEKQMTETAIKARQENLTYGQYQAMKYLKDRG